MKLLGALIRFFWNIGRAREIKNDPNRQPRNCLYAVKSMACAIMAVPAALLMAVMPLLSDGMGGLLVVFWIVIFVAGIVAVVITVLGALFNWFLQLYINRSAMTWISLAVMLAGFAGTAFVVYWVIGLF